MKRIISIILCLFLLLAVVGCSATETKSDKKLSVVTTIFPEYDWVKNILGERAKDFDITMLLDGGVDLHSFQPSADDIIKISTCNLFIYVGGESDEWVDDALKEAVNKDMIVIDLLDCLGDKVKEEEIVEGMQEEDHDEDDHEEEIEYDEHVWLSLKNTKTLVSAIKDAIIKIDKENADTYNANAENYQNKLDALNKEYETAVENAGTKTVLFADRFPFRYLTDDYGLKYYAAFVGCSAESEASFDTLHFLSKKVDELNLKAVLTLEGNDKSIAKTVIKNTKSKDAEILSLDSLQTMTKKDIENGSDYLSVMEKNLKVLKKALG